MTPTFFPASLLGLVEIFGQKLEWTDLGVVALLVLLPMQLLARQSGAVVARGLPELTMALTALLFASSMVASWLVSGAATLVWMSALSGHVRETR